MGDMRAMNTAPDPAKSLAQQAFEPATLRASGLALSRGDTKLAQDLDLSLAPGEAILLIGDNGAGKTTLLRALAGFVRPDAGRVEINGQPLSVTAGELIGWLGHTDGLKPAETVRQSLNFWMKVLGGEKLSSLPTLRALDMDRWIDRPTGRLSRGQQRRIALARVILSNRPIWLLDEPAGPLDGQGRARLAEQVQAHRSRGGSVIAATHQVLDWPDAIQFNLGKRS
jgi:heme exporter protein A